MRFIVAQYSTELVGLVASAIVAYATWRYWRNIRSRSAATLAVAGLGRLLVGVVSSGNFVWYMTATRAAVPHGPGAVGWINIVNVGVSLGLSVLGVVFGLAFAISLLFVLNDAAASRMSGSAGNQVAATTTPTTSPA